jgi:hypothetical protein
MGGCSTIPAWAKPLLITLPKRGLGHGLLKMISGRVTVPLPASVNPPKPERGAAGLGCIGVSVASWARYPDALYAASAC